MKNQKPKTFGVLGLPRSDGKSRVSLSESFPTKNHDFPSPSRRWGLGPGPSPPRQSHLKPHQRPPPAPQTRPRSAYPTSVYRRTSVGQGT
ncbi:Hypothetical protein NTJ_11831 [Nesidiocoris tenuis]|uniref:Uncharacterized protein n=1 Tax=Nesidiocoris tenuis TaxID=355587 RepID=A0ABN7B795_9HEMI|nr:Hypothetical protein NTJ_11831 [Nesidiocoris tenuis]